MTNGFNLLGSVCTEANCDLPTKLQILCEIMAETIAILYELIALQYDRNVSEKIFLLWDSTRQK